MKTEPIEIFVPGRLCLFGEHTDWAAGHRRQNSKIEKGYAIVAPTNQGNYARVVPLEEQVLVFKSFPLGRTMKLDLNEKSLLQIAEEGKEFSYVAGTAHEIIVNYNGHSTILEINKLSHGLEIDNYHSDLPLKKGLSSSASICVLVARAFKEIYNLPLSTRGIMNIAYNGEITTPSRCGKLDQACAYSSPVIMTFNADKFSAEELSTPKPLHEVIVDLKSHKDTKRILAELNKGFPFPTNDSEKKKHEYLAINKKVIEEAVNALRRGDSEHLGTLMTEAQLKFDEHMAPSCPEELTAPKLHCLLSLPKIHPYVFGGKGVGSQGDGCAQFVARDEQCQKELIELLNSDTEIDVHAIPLTISS